MKSNTKISLYAYFFCCAFLLTVAFLDRKWNDTGSQALISWDISGYYLYLPSFFYDDLGKLNNIPYIQEHYDPFGGGFYNAFKMPDGNHVMKYSSGQAIMFLPGFAVAHCWAKWGGYPVDGFSWPYQFCLAMNSLLVAFLGLWMARKILLRYFNDWPVAITLVVLCMATNYLNYVSIVGAFTHSYLFTLYTLLIWLTIKFYEKPKFTTALAMGLLSGLATITRPTEIICILIPAFWNVASWQQLKQRLVLFLQQWHKLAVYLMAAIAVGSIQLIYWKTYSGHWMHWSYGPEETFSFLKPHVINAIFSYRKGWLVYTPVMLLAVVGIIPFYKQHRQLFWGTLIFLSVSTYLVVSWDCWWYGGSFSQRAMIQSYALWIFPLTAFFTWLQGHRAAIIATAIFIIFCVWLNLLQTWQANSDTAFMESDMMNRSYYWRIFGETKITRNDRRMLDTDEELPEKLAASLKPVYATGFEEDSLADTSLVYAGRLSVQVNTNKQWYNHVISKGTLLKPGWYRAYANVYIEGWEGNIWKQAQLGLYANAAGKEVKSKSIRLQRLIDPGKWQEVYTDIYIPEKLKADELGLRLWNADGTTTTHIDNLRVFYVPEQH